MGIPTTDQKNKGARQVQRYSVSGGLSANKSDQETAPVDFVLLKNCLVDKRLNAVVKKPGSVIETISGTLGIPLGLAEHIAGANDSIIPIRRTILANFSGTNWRSNASGSWSTVNIDAGLSLSTSRPSTFSQLGDRLYIAAGLPCYWAGPGNNIRRIGIVPPTGAITVASYNTGSGITLTQGTRYIFTYYDTSTGLESDWSAISDLVPPITDKSIVLNIPAGPAPTNWDGIRIYRYLDGGAHPYLVHTFGAANTTYTDSTPDSQLTTRAAKRYDKAVPCAQSYICANYAQHLWFVDATDPYKLIFSKPYVGSFQDPSYFPIDQTVRTSEPITGLLVTSSRMLVFHPRSISVITGSSKDEFDLKPLIPGLGTVFAQSISTNGTDIVFLSEQGFISVTFGSGARVHLSREIDLDLQPLLAGSYNSAIYASSVWNPSLRQFIFALSALSTVNASWEEQGTGSTADAVAGWETTPGGVTDVWEDVTTVAAGAVTRIKVWGWSPELSSERANMWMEYTFPTSADQNGTGAYITCLVHPSPSADLNDPQQDKTYIGYYTGTAGAILSAFRRDTNTDNATTITSELITGRIAPGQPDGGFKLFQGLGFTDVYLDPTSDAAGTFTYLLDYPDPHLRSYAANLKSFVASDDTDVKKFSEMLGRNVHLRLVDTSQSQSKVLLSEFFIHYRERFRKERR